MRGENGCGTTGASRLIRLFDLPGAPQLHARMELCPGLTPSSDERCRNLMSGILGALGFSLDYWGHAHIPDDQPGEAPVDLTPYDLAELDGEEVAFWKARGWDITTPKGDVVAFFGAVSRAMISVQEGRGGLSRMAVEAELWKLTRANDVDPRQRKQDQSFLALGQRGRRRA